MPNFMENWLKRKYDLIQEVEAVEELMNYQFHGINLFEKIANDNFLCWEFRNNAITVSDFKEKSGIDEKCSEIYGEEPDNVDINLVMEYFEYAINLSIFVDKYAGNYVESKEIKTRCSAVAKNIDSIIKQCNYQMKMNSQNALLLVVKDAIADMACDIVGDSYNLNEDIFIYRHRSSDGNFVGKADILFRMGKYFEKEIKQNMGGKAHLRQLASNIGFLLNNLDLRHPPNQKEEPIIKTLIERKKLEKYYDETYRQIVSIIVLFDCAEKQIEIDELKSMISLGE